MIGLWLTGEATDSLWGEILLLRSIDSFIFYEIVELRLTETDEEFDCLSFNPIFD